MYQIRKMFNFEASHQLTGLPEGHQCGRNHGHSYRVELILESETLNEHGFVVDYGNLDKFADFLKVKFDHQFLNEVVGFQTCAENLAFFLFVQANDWWPQVVECRVSETQKTWASFRPPSDWGKGFIR